MQRDDFVPAEAVDDAGQRAVVHDFALGDDHHAAAERGHVFHVVAGQQDRDLPRLLIVPQESLNVVLGDHVEADRRLVEKQHLGRVEQGGDQFHLHPLAQRQLAHRLAEQLPHVEQIDQFVARALRTAVGSMR